MMKEADLNQLELFQEAGAGHKDRAGYSTLLQRYIRNYEKTIFVIIGFLITGIISFSLGVEKGKKISLSKSNLKLDLAQKIEPPKARVIVPEKKDTAQQGLGSTAKIDEVIKKEVSLVNNATTAAKYTIQVASFTTQTNAQKEAQILAKKGMKAQIITRGKFTILCVGNFPNRKEANLLLAKLRNKYQDCYIRRL